MNKIITILLTLLVFGCANNQIKTSQISIPAKYVYQQPVTPKLVLTTPSQTSPKIKIDSLLVNNSQSATGTEESKALTAQDEESLFPRLVHYIKKGVASWYGPGFHGKQTATGEIFNMYEMTAAHKTLPIPSYAEVTNLENNKTVVVRINDRGPFVGNRLLDLSYAAAKTLGIQSEGTGNVKIKAISPLQALPAIQKTAESQHKKVYMEVGRFGSEKRALKLHHKIASHNSLKPTIVAAKSKQNTFYKVQIGPINSSQNAQQVSHQLARLGIKDPQFVAETRQN